MLKRSNERDDEPPNADDGHQKRRKIQFEPVRMPAVNNVSDIRGRTMVVQATKLKQQLLYKNKRIAELEKENERARRRQATDENQFMKVYNLFSEIAKFICTQTKNEFGEYTNFEMAPTGTVVQGMSTEAYMRFVDETKSNLRNAFVSYAKARQDRSSEMVRHIQKMKQVCEEAVARPDAFNREAIERAEKLALQNEKLHTELTRYQSDAYNFDRKKRNLNDKIEMLNAKVEELEHQLEDAKFEADKQLRAAVKFEYRLATVVAEGAGGSGAVATENKKASTPNTPPSEAAAKEMDTLRSERDEQVELAARRLQELSDANKKQQSMAAEIAKLRVELQHQNTTVSAEVIHASEEFKTLKRYYSLAIKEFERVNKELDEAVAERDSLRSKDDQRFWHAHEEQQRVLKEIQSQMDAHTQFYKVAHDSEILRAEFEAVAAEHSKSTKQAEWDELKATVNTMRAVNSTLKSEVVRQREKSKVARHEVAALKAEVKSLRETQERCLLIPIDESREYAAPDDVIKLRVEYETLRKEVRRIGAIDKLDRQKAVEKELQRQIGDKLTELETLRKANAMLQVDEQSISDELESIGTAVEEEQERNSHLVTERRESEDRHLKMMNDRIIQSQVFAQLKEKLSRCQDRVTTAEQIAKIHEFQSETLKAERDKVSNVNNVKGQELTKISQLLDAQRRTLIETGKARDELQVKADRNESQLKQVQDMYSQKARETEEQRFRRARLEEELEAVRAKYEKAKRNESVLAAGSGDQVLEEANRQMKETLTCPSCKTRPKDCIMLKCYHFFCEGCIKTMYDTRQRKCPKCNTNFGANDFHRVFI